MSAEIQSEAIDAIVGNYHGAPYDVLGPQVISAKRTSIRTFRPDAASVEVVNMGNGKRYPMERKHDSGFFEATLPAARSGLNYHYEAVMHDGRRIQYSDPYAFPLKITEYDLYLLGEGKHLYSYDKLGAHLDEVEGVKGVRFAVWAPNAQAISVIGNFNQWDSRIHPMQKHPGIGIWELFIPGIGEGEPYKYRIVSQFHGYRIEKSDPYGFYGELRPRTASVVANLDQYEWGDTDWMEARAEKTMLNAPMSIYEVHLGSWRRKDGNQWLNYRELAHELVSYVKEMGYTHIELLPITEHPLDASWGYQVTGYYAVSSRFGAPADFMYFIDHCHQNGIGVILDWVPAHFPKDGHGLSFFDGTHLYEHEDWRKGEHPDWGTLIFNYGRNEVRNFLISNALFWLKKYHIDGLRVDAVSSMLYLDFGRSHGQWAPNQYGGNENLDAIAFLREFNTIIHQEAPGSMSIAEESTAWPMVSRPVYVGGLGFTFKWNMGWMHDTLGYLKRDPIFRRFHHNEVTFSMMYAYSENYVLSLSHDEVVHMKGSIINKMAGDWWRKFAGVRMLHGYQMTHPGKKLNFMGAEIGQWREWSEERSLDWFLLELPTHQGLQQWIKDMNHFYLKQPALYSQDYHPNGFRWIDANDGENSVYSYIRFAENPADFIVVLINATPVVRQNYRIGVPEAGFYAEKLNSDSNLYGGSNVGNNGGKHTESIAKHGWPQSLNLTLPPLGVLILKLNRPIEIKKEEESAPETSVS